MSVLEDHAHGLCSTKSNGIKWLHRLSSDTKNSKPSARPDSSSFLLCNLGLSQSFGETSKRCVAYFHGLGFPRLARASRKKKNQCCGSENQGQGKGVFCDCSTKVFRAPSHLTLYLRVEVLSVFVREDFSLSLITYNSLKQLSHYHHHHYYTAFST